MRPKLPRPLFHFATSDPTSEQDKLPASSLFESSQQKAVREMLAFVEKNHVRLEGVTVKELIHEDHCQP
jgi:hypothetical protein